MSSFVISLLSNQLVGVGTGVGSLIVGKYLFSNDKTITNNDINNDYVLIKRDIPYPPELPEIKSKPKSNRNTLNVKVRFANFDCYKKYLKNKKKRHKKKLNKYKNII